MVKLAHSSKIYWAKLLVIYSSFFLSNQIIAESVKSISFSFEEIPLKNALENIVEEFDLYIIYPDSVLKNYNISSYCSNCKTEKVLDKILSKTELSWKSNGDQYIIFKKPKKNNYNFSGRIFNNRTGETIAQANVYIPKLFLGTLSDKNGDFSLIGINTKSCTAFVSFIGYNTKKLKIDFTENEYNKQNIRLIPKIIPSRGVKVSGEIREFMNPSDIPGKILFSPKYISTLPNLGEVDICRSLQLLPGIQYGLGGSSDLFIRGSKPEHTLILLDGIPLYNNNHLFGFISSINSDVLQNAQVYKGGFPVSYGGGISSLVKLTTNVGSNKKTRGIIHSNLLSQGLTISLPLFSRGSGILSFRRSINNKFQATLYQSIQKFVTDDNRFNLISEIENENQNTAYYPHFKFQDLIAKFSFLISPKNILSITFNVSEDNIKENREFYGFENILGVDSTLINESTVFLNNCGILNWTTHWTDNFNTIISFSNYNNKNQYNVLQKEMNNEILGSYIYKYIFSEKISKVNLKFSPSNRSSFTSGINITLRNFDLDTKEKDGISNINLDLFKDEFLFVTFLQYNYLFPSKLFLETGVRSTKNNQKRLYFEPRFSLKKNLSEEISIELSIGKYLQFMHKYSDLNSNRGQDQIWISAGENLLPLKSTNLHFAIINNFKNYNFRCELYAKYIESLFIFDLPNNNQTESPQLNENDFSISHYGNGNILGFELFARKTLGRITGWASYQRNQTMNWFDEMNQNKRYLADHDKTNEFKLVAMTTVKNLQLAANWVYTSGRVYTHPNYINISSFDINILRNQNEERLEPSHHLDISISRNWRWTNQRSIELGLSIYNIYNRKNISHARINPFSNSDKIVLVGMLGLTPTISIKIYF